MTSHLFHVRLKQLKAFVEGMDRLTIASKLQEQVRAARALAVGKCMVLCVCLWLILVWRVGLRVL